MRNALRYASFAATALGLIAGGGAQPHVFTTAAPNAHNVALTAFRSGSSAGTAQVRFHSSVLGKPNEIRALELFSVDLRTVRY